MEVGSFEFYEVRDMFEKHLKNSPILVNSMDRADDDSPNNIFYDCGKTNDLFHMYMLAYQHGHYNGRGES